jgi:uncharacterized protein YrrD
MLLSDIRNRRIMATGTATTVGKVVDIVVDARNSVVTAIRAERTSGGDTLHWTDITRFGSDAVMVGSPDAVGAPAGRTAEILAGDHELVGKRLLTDAGDELGTVTDIAFDEDDGRVTAIRTADGSVSGSLLGCGRYAVVVRP